MPSVQHLLTFAAAAFAIIVVPGPSVLFIISRSVALGRQAGLATVIGNAAGLAVQVTAVAAGLGAVVEKFVVVFTVMKLAGAGYLVWLGIKAIRNRHALGASIGTPIEPRSIRRILREGFIVGVSNPKSVLLFVAILPQFVERDSGVVPLQMMVLGSIAICVALLSDGTWAVAAGTARDWIARRPERLQALGGAGGIVMIGLGIRLALTGRHD